MQMQYNREWIIFEISKGERFLSILSELLDPSTRLAAIIALCYRIPAVLIALSLHELAHGYVALRCGDDTAEMMGRLSFNPLRHLDPFGTICLLLFGFGWAKPVPVNPRKFTHFRRDDFLVSIAGIVVNFCLFLFASLCMILVSQLVFTPETWTLGTLSTPSQFLRFDGVNFYQILSGDNGIITASFQQYYFGISAENMYQYIQTPWLMYVLRFLMYFSMINLGLALFNLIPIPPLDGYHLVNDALAKGKIYIPARVMQILSVVLIILCWRSSFFSKFLSNAIMTVQGFVMNGLLGIFGLA